MVEGTSSSWEGQGGGRRGDRRRGEDGAVASDVHCQQGTELHADKDRGGVYTSLP